MSEIMAETRRIAFDAAFAPSIALEEIRRSYLDSVRQISAMGQHFREQTGVTSIIAESFRQQARISQEISQVARISFQAQSNVTSKLAEFVRESVAAHQRVSEELSAVVRRAMIPAQLFGLESLMEQVRNLHLSDFEELADLQARDDIFADATFDAAADKFKREVLNSPDFQQGSIIVQFNFLGSYAVKQSEPWVRKFALDLMTKVLVAIVMAIGTHALSLLYQQPGMTEKQMTSAIEKAFSESKLDIPELRLVERATDVRTSRRHTATTVGSLKAGSVVRLIEKSGRWSEVEWVDTESATVLHGWVRSKYLQRLKAKHHGGENGRTGLLEDDDR